MCWYSEVGREIRLEVESPKNRFSIFSPRIRIWVSQKHQYHIWIPPSILLNKHRGYPHPRSAPPSQTVCKSAKHFLLSSMSWKGEQEFTVFMLHLAVHQKYFVIAKITVKCHCYEFALRYDSECYPWVPHYPNSLRHIKTKHLCSNSSPHNNAFPPANHLELQNQFYVVRTVHHIAACR